jgi:hypothetical protein
VVDHVNHFSPQSLTKLLELAGLEVQLVSSSLHESALVVIGRKPATARKVPESPVEGLDELATRVASVATYWRGFRDRVQAFERLARASDLTPAIYGSGFYGSYIATCLIHASEVQCFADQNPFRQGKTLMGKPIVAPEALPPNIQAVYVGLNPARAHAEIEKIETFRPRSLRYFVP